MVCYRTCTEPDVVVETGIDKGLGTCVFAAALRKNDKDGKGGYLYATELESHRGGLFTEPYSNYGKILYGDSITRLNDITEDVDFFIHDSYHAEGYEKRELTKGLEMLSEDGFLASDNAHASDALFEVAIENNMTYRFFSEEPEDHWYRGAGIGIAHR